MDCNVTPGADFWKPISTAPRDCNFIALGNEEMAIVWWEPEAGAKWKIMNIPGMGVRLGVVLAVNFHSWCTLNKLHRFLDRQQCADYYLPGTRQ